jgi:hypothetical protein
MLQAGKLFLAGALSFWGPELLLYAWKRKELDWVTLTIVLPLCLIVLYSIIRLKRHQHAGVPSASIFMLLGVWFWGPLAMVVGATFVGGGLIHSPAKTAAIALLLGFFPPYAFIAATYDGSLFGLIFVSAALVVFHSLFERKSWILPPRWKGHSVFSS